MIWQLGMSTPSVERLLGLLKLWETENESACLALLVLFPQVVPDCELGIVPGEMVEVGTTKLHFLG